MPFLLFHLVHLVQPISLFALCHLIFQFVTIHMIHLICLTHLANPNKSKQALKLGTKIVKKGYI